METRGQLVFLSRIGCQWIQGSPLRSVESSAAAKAAIQSWQETGVSKALPEQLDIDRHQIAVVAILGPLDASDEMQLELMRSGAGDRCLIVTDSEAAVPEDWRSVIKLPSGSSWEACWLEGMIIVLTVLLPAVDRGLAMMDVTEILDDLKGRWSYVVVANADRGERIRRQPLIHKYS